MSNDVYTNIPYEKLNLPQDYTKLSKIELSKLKLRCVSDIITFRTFYKNWFNKKRIASSNLMRFKRRLNDTEDNLICVNQALIDK